jgi:hypothetical protein
VRPAQRPTALECLQHEWFKNVENTDADLVRERERERERVSVCVRESARARKRVREKERERVCEREREARMYEERYSTLHGTEMGVLCVFFFVVGVSAGAWAVTNSIHLQFIVGGHSHKLPPPHAPH